MPSPPFHRLSLIVPARSIDANGHVNNVEYVRWMQDAAISHADTSGCTAATKAIGATWVVRTHHVEYLRPAFLNDPILIITWVATVQKVRSLRKYHLYHAETNTLLAKGETEWIFIDGPTGRPRSIPPEVTSCFTLSSAEPG
ncbi:thioesterase family protein [soil metagenome]